MNALLREGFDLIDLLPRPMVDVECSVVAEMSVLGAHLVSLYVPPQDSPGIASADERESHVLFWDFPGLSRVYFRSLMELATFVPIRWLLVEDSFGVWMHTTIPKIPNEYPENPATQSIIADVQTAFHRVCGVDTASQNTFQDRQGV